MSGFWTSEFQNAAEWLTKCLLICFEWLGQQLIGETKVMTFNQA